MTGYRLTIGGRELVIERVRIDGDTVHFDSGADSFSFTCQRLGPGRWRVDGRPVLVESIGNGFQVATYPGTLELRPQPLTDATSEAGGDDAAEPELRAPMPAQVVEVLVEPGQRVERGEPLVVVAAMKLETTLAAPRDGTVAEVLVAAGDQVDADQPLLRLSGEEA